MVQKTEMRYGARNHSEVKQKEKELLTKSVLRFACALSLQIHCRGQNNSHSRVRNRFKPIEDLEAQENKAHGFGIYYHSGRAKPFRFILQVPKEQGVFFSGESFLNVHQMWHRE